MAVQLSFAPVRVFSATAGLQAGARAYFYQSGTTTLEAVYTDESLAAAHPSPLVADAEGAFAQVFHSGSPALKCVITDSLGNTLYTIDPVRSSSTGSDASEVSFSPVADNAATNVQAAIAANTVMTVANKELAENALKLPQTAGSGNAYTLAAPATITAYASGQSFQFVVDRDNTGAVTLDVDGLGPKSVKRYNNNTSLTALVADDWRVGEVHQVTYNGTDFAMISPIGAKVGGVRGIVESATTAEAQAGTADEKYPDVVKVKAAIDAQTLIKARASINGTGGTPSASGGLNIASVVDNGTGDYTINFTNNISNANYQVSVQPEGNGHGSDLRAYSTVVKSVGNVRIRFVNATNTATDYDFSFIVTAGALA